MSVALALTVTLAAAAVVVSPTPVLNCTDPQSNLEMKMCAAQELKKAEAELSAAFARALKAAQEQYASVRAIEGLEKMPDMPEALRTAERDWETFRDANCDYQRLVYYGGSMAPLAVTTCRLDMTKTRIKELTDLVEQQ